MSGKYHVFIIVIILGLLGGGCGTTSSAPTPSPSSTISVTAPSFDWARPHNPVTVSNGLQIKSCGGDAPVVCAYRDGKSVGQMELLTYDTTSDEETLTLEMRVKDYYKNISADRKEVCPQGYEVQTIDPQKVTVTGKLGLRAELVIKSAQGKPVEKYIVFMLKSDRKLYVFTISGYEHGSCVSEEVEYTTIQNLNQGVLEAFEAIVKTSILPK